ncbi:gliding motility lipoprotein GldH [Tenacibaculum sp. SG-28]|uniref:gliding motility lipoprotein GldH n=1 Tax=Tenacibaculum sp. SG-28 TaxID=754426 RepID=UPI000D496326|nr:gliding motility lipoprotein GldH [Tenacibaculum sp. SG-28]PQJ21789.1 gliding motility lipoprotein GldH [Tenacibaculum sp. SG-28]
MAVVLLFVSCDANRVFDEYQPIEEQQWNKHNTLRFPFEVKDSVQQHNLFISLRNNKEYAYSNLFLIATLRFPDGNVVVDTLEYAMADSAGKFLGRGFTDVKDNKLFYKENIVFPTKGRYTFEVRQAMRKNGEANGIEALEGVTHVGFRIEKIK